ncbi:MAG: heat-inducible transcriptional repressor HrcA [Oscillospiraceae bacterium]|nr:heat-inducible transcriptional repressor HrcA [Oscillospiraceae bacterium]MDD7294521.1 heat-inducible transcriptional repressor HrcA [Oscillospiraceae bacterium]MDY2509452.1 heat-inducible transcriptional repressor HrcA [Ruminococcus callidus]
MDARKKNVLLAVVETYIRTGEPVGSKIISQLPQIHVSAATVRNDMAVLEELGYLEQPHTSAGRVPTYSGYRFYIDQVVQEETLPESERERLDAMLGDESQMTEELLIQSATTALAEVTKCATVVSDFAPKYSVISKVEVIPTGKRLYVVLLITSNGTIKNKACRLEFDLTEEHMQFFRNFMQENLQGVSISDLSEERMDQMITAMGAYMMALSPLVQGVCEMSRDLQKHKVYVSGEQNLLSCQDLNQAEVVQFISHKNEFRGLLDDSFNGIKVVFGEEGDRFVIGNSSMIVSKYQKGKQAVGSLGIIGPMRLDYAKIIPYIEYFTEKLSHLISEEDDEADNE